MMKQRAGTADVLRYLAAFDGKWSNKYGCDICVPIELVKLEKYISDTVNLDKPWLCDNHARELGLMW